MSPGALRNFSSTARVSARSIFAKEESAKRRILPSEGWSFIFVGRRRVGVASASRALRVSVARGRWGAVKRAPALRKSSRVRGRSFGALRPLFRRWLPKMEAIEAPVFRIALSSRRSRKSLCVPSATSSTRLQGSARAIGGLGPGCYVWGCSALPASTRQKRAASTRCCLNLCLRSSNKATQSTFHRFKSFSSQENEAEEQIACSWSRACHQPQYDSVRRNQSGPLPRKGLIRSDPHTIALAQKSACASRVARH